MPGVDQLRGMSSCFRSSTVELSPSICLPQHVELRVSFEKEERHVTLPASTLEPLEGKIFVTQTRLNEGE
jgi:hypothetical protein